MSIDTIGDLREMLKDTAYISRVSVKNKIEFSQKRFEIKNSQFLLFCIVLEEYSDFNLYDSLINFETIEKFTKNVDDSTKIEDYLISINQILKRDEEYIKMTKLANEKLKVKPLEMEESNEVCGRCKQRKIYKMNIQTRGSDEQTTTFFKCLNCNNTWSARG